MDIRLNALTGDVDFKNGMDVVVAKDEELQQRLTIRLNTFLGEWIINPNYGVPYFQQIFGKGRKKSTIDSLLQEQILADGSVLEIIEFNSSITGRQYSLTFKVRVVSGEAIEPVTIEVNI